MTQSIVPFVIGNSNIIPGASSTDPQMLANVFSAVIDQSSQGTYTFLMQNVLNAFNNIQDQLSGGGSTLDAGNFSAMLDNLNALNAWAELITVDTSTGQQSDPHWNFIQPGNTSATTFDPANFRQPGTSNFVTSISSTITSTMSGYMGQALEQINRLIKSVQPNGQVFLPDSFSNPQLLTGTVPSAGYGPGPYDPIQAFVNSVIALAQGGSGSSSSTDTTVYQLGSAITRAISVAQQAQIVDNAATQSKSIQQALAVDYIMDGNSRIFNNLNSLNDAININQRILQFLNSLQDLMNAKDPQKFALQFTNLSSNSSAIDDSSYQNFEQQSFSQQLGTIARFTGDSAGTLATANTLFQQAFTNINNVGDMTDPNTFTYAKATLTNNIDNLVTALLNTGSSASSGLVSALNQIKTDLNGSTSISEWVQDFDTSATATNGAHQQDMNNAVTAAQSFNQTQQANLQQAMFIFQQFYQSASGLMSQIDQVIRNAASYIAK